MLAALGRDCLRCVLQQVSSRTSAASNSVLQRRLSGTTLCNLGKPAKSRHVGTHNVFRAGFASAIPRYIASDESHRGDYTTSTVTKASEILSSPSSPAQNPPITSSSPQEDRFHETAAEELLQAPPSTRTAIGKIQRRLSITFTCSVVNCGERSTHEFSRHSYEKGIVLVQCPKCESRHLIGDLLSSKTLPRLLLTLAKRSGSPRLV